MTKFFLSHATPLITGLFIVSLISGIGLFFHVGPGGFRAMHEWLSMLLILPFGLHLWRNWRPMVGYFRHLPMALALVISAIAAGIFLLPTGGAATAGGPPQFRLAHAVLSHTPAEVAPGIGLTVPELSARLTAAGFTLGDAAQTLKDIAAASGKSEADMAAALVGGDA